MRFDFGRSKAESAQERPKKRRGKFLVCIAQRRISSRGLVDPELLPLEQPPSKQLRMLFLLVRPVVLPPSLSFYCPSALSGSPGGLSLISRHPSAGTAAGTYPEYTDAAAGFDAACIFMPAA